MSLLCRAEASTLLIIDVQVNLVTTLHDRDGLMLRARQLGAIARELGVHVIATEHDAASLGPLVDELRPYCDTTLGKSHFSAAAEPGFLQRLPAGRTTFVVIGCEAHVAVLQTTADLLDAGHHVKWVSDAVGARRVADHAAASGRARAMGADVVTTEMVAFEWLRQSAHPSHARVMALLR